MNQKAVRLVIVGGHRGGDFSTALGLLAGKLELAAVCDLNPAVLARFAAEHPGILTFDSFDQLLLDDTIDAVFLATPVQLHAAQATAALRAGKHVLSEVIAAATLDDCWALVETVESSGRVFMMAENYCYMRPHMMVRNMAEQNVFGALTYAEGAYIHDCRRLLFDSRGEYTWRGDLWRGTNGNTYPTHSLGPIAQWFAAQPGGDQLIRTATFMTRPVGVGDYVREHFGADHPAANPAHFGHGDSATTVIETRRGALIVLRNDISSPRPHNMTHHVLQGSKGAYLSARFEGEDPLVWFDGARQGHSFAEEARWSPLWRFSEQYEHPRWRALGEEERKMGHGGGDAFVLTDFLSAIQEGIPPAIDVYDAVLWSAILPLSAQSAREGNRMIEIPDFRRGRSIKSE